MSLKNHHILLIRGEQVISGYYQDFIKSNQVFRIRTTNSPAVASTLTRTSTLTKLTNWQPLCKILPQWKSELQSNPDVANLYLLDCGANGDCLFYCLAAGYNQFLQDWKYSMQSMRLLASNQLQPFFLQEFCLANNLPTNLTLNQVRQIITTSNSNTMITWGTEAYLLYLFLHAPEFKKYHLGFLVLVWDSTTNTIKTHIFRLITTRFLLALYCENDYHWLLLGYASATGNYIASSFPIAAYPLALFPYLNEIKKK